LGVAHLLDEFLLVPAIRASILVDGHRVVSGESKKSILTEALAGSAPKSAVCWHELGV
jgi:hypothetical protein